MKKSPAEEKTSRLCQLYANALIRYQELHMRLMELLRHDEVDLGAFKAEIDKVGERLLYLKRLHLQLDEMKEESKSGTSTPPAERSREDEGEPGRGERSSAPA